MTDYLKLAQGRLSDARSTANEEALARGVVPGQPAWTADQEIQLSIAAALIALAERKPQFVQAGERTFCPDCISNTFPLHSGALDVVFRNGSSFVLAPPDAAAFLKWWHANANVVQITAEEKKAAPPGTFRVRDQDGTPESIVCL